MNISETEKKKVKLFFIASVYVDGVFSDSLLRNSGRWLLIFFYQEHHDLLLATLPAAESALEVCSILHNGNLLSPHMHHCQPSIRQSPSCI